MKRVLFAVLIVALIAGASVLLSTTEGDNEAIAAPPKPKPPQKKPPTLMTCPKSTCHIKHISLSSAQRSASQGAIVDLTNEQKALVAQQCPAFQSYTKAKKNEGLHGSEWWDIINRSDTGANPVCLELKGYLE